MHIVTYDALSDDILKKLENANVFYSKEYSTISDKTLYVYNQHFVQVVVISSIRNVFKTATLVCEPHCLSEDGYKKEQLVTFLNNLMQELKEKVHVDKVNVTHAASLFRAYPDVSKRIRWGNYVIDFNNKSIEDVFQGFDSKHRNMVRRGERSELEIKFGGLELLEDYLELDKQTWLRNNRTDNHTSLYRTYLDKLGEKAIIAIAYDQNHVPLCGIFGFYSKAMFYYMFGASADRPSPGSTHYLQYRMMAYMIEKGVKAYNFVGCRINVDKDSKYAHIQHFKKGFGGALEECYLFKAELNKFKCRLFRLLSKILNKGTGTDVIDEEIYKWQDINE